MDHTVLPANNTMPYDMEGADGSDGLVNVPYFDGPLFPSVIVMLTPTNSHIIWQSHQDSRPYATVHHVT